MNQYRNQRQFELFPSTKSKNAEPGKKTLFFRPLVLKGESLIVLAAVLIMSMVVSYSLGVEKGKKSSFADARRQLVEWKKELEASLQAKYRKMAQAAPAPVESQRVEVTNDSSPTTYNSDSNTASHDSVPIEKKVDNQYTIQVASFKLEKHAKQEALTLQNKGFETLVMPKGSYMIVCVGQFKERNEAKDFSRQLKREYKDLLVRRM